MHKALIGEGYRLLEKDKKLVLGDETVCESTLRTGMETWTPIREEDLGQTVEQNLVNDADANERLFRRKIEMIEGQLAYETYYTNLMHGLKPSRRFVDLDLPVQQAWAKVEMAITKQTMEIVRVELLKAKQEEIEKNRLDHLAQEAYRGFEPL